MNIQNRTVLITGGGSGIGFETAKLLSKKGNTIIIIGRNLEKLKNAADSLQNVVPLPCDVTDADAVKELVNKLNQDYPQLSVLINNAGKAFRYEHGENAGAYENARQEMETNYLSVIRLTELLLPLLKKQPDSIIVNVSSIVALSPVTVIPTYSDSKAALHSYTLSLRKALEKNTHIKVLELMPQIVNTELSKDINGATNGIPPSEVATALVNGLEDEALEVGVGITIPFSDNFFPKHLEAFEAINQR